MREFNSLKLAASYALGCIKPAFVFDGPSEAGGYVVAIGREARELMAFGLEPLSLAETVAAAS